MSKLRTLAFMAVASVMLMATSCPDRYWAEKEQLARISQAMREACVGVVDIPSRDLTREDILRLWATDRENLYLCAQKHAYLAQAIDILEKYYSR